MDIEVKWKRLTPRSPDWECYHCLYAYIHPTTGEVLYIGKAGQQTVRERSSCKSKLPVIDYLERVRGLSSIHVLLGDLHLESGRRLTPELLSDVETLLIKRIQPAANIMARRSRVARPGMRVQCTGNWPHARSAFVDRG